MLTSERDPSIPDVKYVLNATPVDLWGAFSDVTALNGVDAVDRLRRDRD